MTYLLIIIGLAAFYAFYELYQVYRVRKAVRWLQENPEYLEGFMNIGDTVSQSPSGQAKIDRDGNISPVLQNDA